MTSSTFALRLSLAQQQFERGEYLAASRALADLVSEVEQEAAASTGGHSLHPTTDLRLLLARAYFHSAQLGRAEAVLRRLTDECPTDAYAHLLLGRTLSRAGRHEEAARPLALAQVLGDYEDKDLHPHRA
ncbi:tetratricopeptide repeat protein [Terracoccus luteus]|uniref:Tetratricopeptide repeat protein n=1 Tax=Terracoccus luteus TaxID=53356 RepID=A0A495XW45_9MICO|nr:tetratricopeptide repeat protein [Terracoccus luteus]RKT78790.1 tetratricopeptide repeat protein [Terracoccus luteus]